MSKSYRIKKKKIRIQLNQSKISPLKVMSNSSLQPLKWSNKIHQNKSLKILMIILKIMKANNHQSKKRLLRSC